MCPPRNLLDDELPTATGYPAPRLYSRPNSGENDTHEGHISFRNKEDIRLTTRSRCSPTLIAGQASIPTTTRS